MSLPSHYLITPNPDNEAAFMDTLEKSFQSGTRLLQLKGKGMAEDEYEKLAKAVIAAAHRHACKVLLTGDPLLVERLGADGLHLDSHALQHTTTRPLPDNYLVAVSGHTLEAIKQGEAIDASFAVLSPVNYTRAHPDIQPLGWDGFKTIVSQVSMPVYALGGVSAEDEATAIAAGGQGVAGNKGYWKE